MQGDLSESFDKLKEIIKNFSFDITIKKIGRVISVGDGIITVSGLKDVGFGEILIFPNKIIGLVIDLRIDSVGVMVLQRTQSICQGDLVHSTGEFLEVNVGMGLLGRVLDPLGNPIDGKGEVSSEEKRLIEKEAPSIVDRVSVFEPVITGIKALDALIPIGRGQRELIIGDRQVGKTSLAIDTIISQKKRNDALPPKERLYCVYVAIGQKQSSTARVVDLLEKHGAMEYTVVVSAGASDLAALQFIAPYSGCAIGEYFRDSGMHVLVVYDDLSKHAVAYRQISLLMRHPPGREAYPGDIFYVHSRLLERAAKIKKEKGGGSLTALPIIETQEGDISAYIPTNVISITDGQIFLDVKMFREGQKPAINVGLSVSRVGSAAQVKSIKKATKMLKLQISQFRELETFSKFGSDIDQNTKDILEKGKRLVMLLRQGFNSTLGSAEQVVVLFAGINNYLATVKLSYIERFEKALLHYVNTERKRFMDDLEQSGDLDEKKEQELHELIKSFIKVFAEREKEAFIREEESVHRSENILGNK